MRLFQVNIAISGAFTQTNNLPIQSSQVKAKAAAQVWIYQKAIAEPLPDNRDRDESQVIAKQ